MPAASGDGEFRSRWLIIPVEAMLCDTAPDRSEMIMEIVTGDESVIVTIGPARSGPVRRRGRPGDAVRPPDLVVTGPPKPILGLISGSCRSGYGQRFGVRVEGDRGVLTRTGAG